jgi:hypothetical protein
MRIEELVKFDLLYREATTLEPLKNFDPKYIRYL